MKTFIPPHPYVVAPHEIAGLCRCGRPHPPAETRCYTGADAIPVLATDALNGGYRALRVIADTNTQAVAGREVFSTLQARLPHVSITILPTPLSATQQKVEEIVGAAQEDALLIAVGAGTINDLTKAAATRLEIPYWVVPTAPSMNGYTSGITALKVAGVKRTLPAAPPQCIYALPGVISGAPADLIQAGYCDVMAKSVSDIDWQIESRLFSGSYCPMPSGLMGAVETTYLAQPRNIAAADPQTVMGLFKGLLISGVAMRVAGSSAPASGGEHLISHVWDMREALTGRAPELHGKQVAAGIIVSACCYEQLAGLSREDIPDSAGDIIKAETERIATVWGSLAQEIQDQFVKKQPALVALNTALRENWDEIQGLCRQVRPPDHFLSGMRACGFDLCLKSINIDPAEFELAVTTARTIRDRITVLDLAAQTGVLNSACQDARKRLS